MDTPTFASHGVYPYPVRHVICALRIYGTLVNLTAKYRREVVMAKSVSVQALRLVEPANRLFERLRRAGMDKSGNREFLYSVTVQTPARSEGAGW